MPDGFRRRPASAQAACHDLLSLLLDETVPEIRGTPTRRECGGRSCWSERYRIGPPVKERCLGEDPDVLRGRFGSLERLKGEGKARRCERARLVRLLRSERSVGLEGATGSLLAAFARRCSAPAPPGGPPAPAP